MWLGGLLHKALPGSKGSANYPCQPEWGCPLSQPLRRTDPPSMMNIAPTDRKATADEVRAHADALRQQAEERGAAGTQSSRRRRAGCVHC
jgi:hypothetical protein